MPTVVRDPVEIEELMERRRQLDVDRFDEVWDGVLHVNPAPSFEHSNITHQMMMLLDAPARAAGLIPGVGGVNIGLSKRNFRIPDAGLHRPGTAGLWLPTAALVVEIRSPNDETWEKLPFYAQQNVDEVLIIEPSTRTVKWLALAGGEYAPVERSGLIEFGPAELAQKIDWP
jgi:Uma2 family endonuclease